jgi:hypothetical protein
MPSVGTQDRGIKDCYDPCTTPLTPSVWLICTMGGERAVLPLFGGGTPKEGSVEPETGVIGALDVVAVDFFGTTLLELILLGLSFIMLAAGLMKDIHALSDNTFVVVCVVMAPIPSLSIPFNHIVLGFVIDFLEMPKFKDVLVRIEVTSPSTANGCR